MLDILAIQTPSQKTGAQTQTSKNETPDRKDQAFADEYNATGGDKDEGESRKADEAKPASDASEPVDEAKTSEDSDDVLSDGAWSAESPDQETDKQPAFGIVEGVKQPTAAAGETKMSASDVNPDKRVIAADLLKAQVSEKNTTGTQTDPEKAVVTKPVAAGISTAEVVFTAKAAENETPQRAEALIEKSVKAPGAELQVVTAPLVKQEGKQPAVSPLPVARKQTSEEFKATLLGDELRHLAPTLRSEAPVQPISPVTTMPQQSANITPVTMLAKAEAGKEKSALDPLGALNLDAVTQGETRSTSTTTTASLNQLLGRAETPAMIARQMAEALQKLPDRPVEISLNPKELGRVRMNISAADAGITVTIVTERPETLDMMRRNIDQLVREFQAIGYNDINFAFSEGEAQNSFSDGGADSHGQPATQLELLEAEDTEIENERNISAQSGVDIRL